MVVSDLYGGLWANWAVHVKLHGKVGVADSSVLCGECGGWLVLLFVVVVLLGVTRFTGEILLYFSCVGPLGFGGPRGSSLGGGGTTFDRQPARKRGVSPKLGGPLIRGSPERGDP